MVTVLLILILCVIAAMIWTKASSASAAHSNRYAKKTKRYSPRTRKEPTLDQAPVSFSAPSGVDDVLGLNESSAPREHLYSTLYLMAPSQAPYAGYELLQSLLSAGMRFGSQAIFHKAGFSIAQATEPGTFDVDNMGGETCQGLVCFFDAANVDDAPQTFDQMLETLQQLCDDIGGALLDADRELLDMDVLQAYRDQLINYERAQVNGELAFN